MRCMKFLGAFTMIAGCVAFPGGGNAAEKTAADRGRDLMFHRSLNPSVWSMKAYDNVWKQWGLKEKPANYEQMFRERYGLHAVPDKPAGLPLGLLQAGSILGKGVVNNCVLCHAGAVAGQTYIGLGNSNIDLQSLFEDLTRADGLGFDIPFPFSTVRGTVDPVNPSAFLMQFRDAELNLQSPRKMQYSAPVSSDPPAWWLLKRKKTRDWTGTIDARSSRVDMVNLLTPLNSGDYIKKQEQAFVDISAFLLTVDAPKYPFAVDQKKADAGKELFAQNCAKCHGTYGPDGKYPDKIVPLDKIGTDRTLCDALTPDLTSRMNQTWFTQELAPGGKPMRIADSVGYQAPPLDGIWATAPYFHNSSAPTVYHVLNSKARPKIFTRSYRSEIRDYDSNQLGLKVEVLEEGAKTGASAWERRKIYDTMQPGLSNAGHTYGDGLSEDDRMAVIEYLKTL